MSYGLMPRSANRLSPRSARMLRAVPSSFALSLLLMTPLTSHLLLTRVKRE